MTTLSCNYYHAKTKHIDMLPIPKGSIDCPKLLQFWIVASNVAVFFFLACALEGFNLRQCKLFKWLTIFFMFHSLYGL